MTTPMFQAGLWRIPHEDRIKIIEAEDQLAFLMMFPLLSEKIGGGDSPERLRRRWRLSEAGTWRQPLGVWHVVHMGSIWRIIHQYHLLACGTATTARRGAQQPLTIGATTTGASTPGSSTITSANSPTQWETNFDTARKLRLDRNTRRRLHPPPAEATL